MFEGHSLKCLGKQSQFPKLNSSSLFTNSILSGIGHVADRTRHVSQVYILLERNNCGEIPFIRFEKSEAVRHNGLRNYNSCSFEVSPITGHY